MDHNYNDVDVRHHCWAVEETILHSYPGVFLAFQAILFATAIYLLFGQEGGNTEFSRQFLFFSLFVVGAFTCNLWSKLFKDRALAAKYWFNKLEKEPLMSDFKEHRKKNNTFPFLSCLLPCLKGM